MKPGVIDVMRRFLPEYLASNPVMAPAVQRAVWAINNCQTPALGGHTYHCADCGEWEYAAHSCNHRSCPLCGKGATAKWVDRELEKRVGGPYFMVTFTLPSELRDLFFGRDAKQAYNLFFSASSKALKEKLAEEPDFGAEINGFTGILHTWNQRLLFHPHIHYIVPGSGINAEGEVITVKYDKYLVCIKKLTSAFREHFRDGLAELGWQVDPATWKSEWGINVQPFGDGENVIKYLGAYVCRTAIGDSRIQSIDEQSKTVTFTWKDRSDKNNTVTRTETITGVEFVTRYLRHVLPRGLRSIRYYGFCHPAAKKNRQRIAFHTGLKFDTALELQETSKGKSDDDETTVSHPGKPVCRCCGKIMKRIGSFPPQSSRPKIDPSTTSAAATNSSVALLVNPALPPPG